MRRLLPLIALVAACGSPTQEPPPVTTLTPAADTVTLTDTDIGDAAWLGGDRWALLVPSAHAVRIVDFATHRTTLLGTPGKDYLEPFSIFVAGPELYVGDWGMRRVTAWSTDGKLVATFEAPAPFRGNLPRGRDASGAWYAELRPFPGADGSGNRDSGAVVRWNAGTTIDTVTKLVPYEVEPVVRNGGRRYERLVFSGTDQWGVDPDGTVWVARVNRNALERCRAGTCRSGPRLRDPVLEVRLEDREYFLQSFPADQRSLARDLPFAVVKPPFTHAFEGGSGTTWVEQVRSLTDSHRGYRLLDTAGVAIREFQIANAQRILGATATHILAIDPLVPGPGHRVLRYAIPAMDTVGVKGQ